LCNALSRLRRCRTVNIKTEGFPGALKGLVTGKFSDGPQPPDPDLITGAGHHTHAAMLSARHSRGGKCVVIMTPSIPVSWFDLCLIPEHDNPEVRENIVTTKGALTTVLPAQNKDPDLGLILTGGPSRHFTWDEPGLMKQITRIVSDAGHRWYIADSPRTPETTRALLGSVKGSRLEYRPYPQTSRTWLEQQLAEASLIWVTEDSISMISEALTCGAGVGLLSVPAKGENRISQANRELARANYVTTFADWCQGHPLSPPSLDVNESERCAKIIIERFGLG
jgi:hypothetical protein